MEHYDFEQQRRAGACGEAVIWAYFAELGYRVRAATAPEQRSGIDFWLELSSGDESVEVKTDSTAGRTHNAFIETVSVDSQHKPGWVHTCRATWLVYYVPDDGLAYILRPAAVRAALLQWRQRYGTRHAQNDGYRTHGVVIPLSELEALAVAAVCP